MYIKGNGHHGNNTSTRPVSGMEKKSEKLSRETAKVSTVHHLYCMSY